jgi:hypothetical protein
LIRLKQKISGFLAVAGVLACFSTSMAQDTPADSAVFQQWLDSLGLKKTDLEAKVQSTLMFGGSAPVSFSGEGRLKLQYHRFRFTDTKLVQADRSYLQSGWDGNESMVRLGMVVRPGRNTVLWSKLGFQSTFPGWYTNKRVFTGDTSTPVQYMHDKSRDPANIHEDMNAGIAIRTVPVSFMLKLGAVQWTEASPLTVWKAQPRNFAWEYLPYEVEQPIARYFEYNIARGEKSGRAAWNKKAFQGVNFESINLPANLYFNFLYGTFERYDNFEREYIDFTNDVAYAGESDISFKGKGIGDSYRRLIHGRIAAKELFGRLTPSLNFVSIQYDKDIYTNNGSNNSFTKNFDFFDGNFYADTVVRKGFYKEPYVGSFELRGPISDRLSIQGDLAFNLVDSVWVTKTYPKIDSTTSVFTFKEKHVPTSVNLGFYSKIESKFLIPVRAELAYFAPGFYSPFSFVTPVDAFYPFGANMVGPGKFIGRGEGSPYTQNMAGVNLQVAPNLPGYGHLKVIYGQHWQIKPAQDVLYFPYRLNGQDFYSVFHSSYNRWGNDLLDLSLATLPGRATKYTKRVGDETYRNFAYASNGGPEAGGLRSDYLSTFEGFVPYDDSISAKMNVDSTGKGTIFTRGKWVPKNQKFTFNFELDCSYDISQFIGYKRDFFLGFYWALNGVSSTMTPIAFNDKGKSTMLWGNYLRFETAVALTSKFYVVGMMGYENWRSQKAYLLVNADRKQIKKSPIDYRDYAYGIGFDWDVLSRVGLHTRVKYMEHNDMNFYGNNWHTPVITTEIKMWF